MSNLSFFHGGNIFACASKYKKNLVDFSANINPLGLPQNIKNKLNKSYKKVICYPDPHSKSLIRQIARYWQIGDDNILLGNGSCEFIYLILHTFMPKKVLIPAPTFCEYERAANSIKAKIRFLELKEHEGFNLNSSNEKNADIIFISNPNNPTGNLILKEKKLEKFTCRLNVIDEAFMDFLSDERRHTFINQATQDKGVMVMRSFTKFFALPGLRLGYLIAHRDNIDKLKSHQPPWNINSLAQVMGEAILKDREYIRATRKFIVNEKKFLIRELGKIRGIKLYPSTANFILIKIEKDGLTSSYLTEALLENGILVRDCSNFRNLSHKFMRIAVRKRSQNYRLIAGLKNIINNNG